VPHPNREPETARDLRRSPFHDRLAARGARFGEKLGWERPLWFRREGLAGEPVYAFERPGWLANVAAEHHATREDVALFDQTSFAKYLVQGPDACAALQWLCSADIDVPAGRAVYTALLTERGTFMSDLIVLRLAEDRYYLVTAAAQQVHDAAWITPRLHDWRAGLTDVTSSYAVLGVHGPRSRALLQRLTSAPLDSAAFPFHSAQWIDIGGTRALALRVSFVGELGWELHVPTEQAAALYETVVTATGEDVTHAGFTALTSLRLEKAFGLWGADFSVADTPLEAAHAFLCDWDKPGGFLGREALLRQRAEGIRRRLTCFVLDDPEPLLWGGEPIFRDGQPVGYTSSGGYGHSAGGSVALGYVGASEPISRAWLRAGRYEIDVAGERVPATAHLRAPYDPERSRMVG
jgi:4-methylaminobutanoate oxidase (formaldehyde-forming)